MDTPANPKNPWFKNSWIKFRSLYKFIFRSKRPFKLTRGGWIFILYTIGIGAGAINTGNNLLYLIFGLFLGFILASGVLSDLSLWGLNITPLYPLSGRANQSLYIPIQLTNVKSWWPSLSIQVEMEATLNGRTLSGFAYCPSIEKLGEATPLIAIHPRERGLLKVRQFKLSTRFPFGLLTKTWTVPADEVELLISPALIEVEPSAFQFLLERPRAMQDHPFRGEGTHFYGTREYQFSDNPKRIHWRTSAKLTEGWVVKEMERESDEEIIFIWPEKNIFDELFVSFTASIFNALERQHKIPILMVNSKETVDEELMRFLCVVKSEAVQHLEASQISGVSLETLFNEWRKQRAA